MCSFPVGSRVSSRQGQSGVVVPRTTSLWPTLVQVKWSGTSFVTFEDPLKLALADDVLSAAQSVRRARVIDAHAAMLTRARQRAGALS